MKNDSAPPKSLIHRSLKSALFGIIGTFTFAANPLHAVLIDIQGSYDGISGGEFGNFSGFAAQQVVPSSSVTESGYTLTFDPVSASTSASARNWSTGWTAGGPYSAGAEVNLRAGSAGLSTSAADAITNASYVEISLTTPGTAFDLDSVSVSFWRNGTGAAQNYQLAYSSDATWTTADLLGSATNVTTTGTASGLTTVSYSGLSLPTNTTDATVRLYFWGATSNGGNTHYYDVEANYTVVPEPTTFTALLVGLGGCVVLSMKRSRNRRS